MNISLGKHFEEMIRAKVESGTYANASEVVREALRRFEEDEEKLTRLREKIAVAQTQFDRGEGIEITDVRAFVEGIRDRAIARVKEEEARKGKVHAAT
jgi:antitoxin ParD1/3/4